MFNLAPILRALTSGSPITTALHEWRRMARRHLETGGVVMSVDGRKRSPGLVVPSGVDVVALGAAIEAKLRAGARTPPGRVTGRPDVLQRMPNGQLVVPGVMLERLGGGNADHGKRFLERLIAEMRRLRAGGRTA